MPEHEVPDEKEPQSRASAIQMSDEERAQRVIQKITAAYEETRVLIPIQLGCVFTLADFRAVERYVITGRGRLQDLLINKFQLDMSIRALNQHFSFLDRLQKVSSEILDKVSLHYMYFCQEEVPYSDAKLALMEDEQLITIPIEVLKYTNLEIFSLRLLQIFQNRQDLVNELPLYNQESPLQSPAALLPLLPAETIHATADRLPAKIFALFDIHQCQRLDFSRLSPEQILHSMNGYFIDKDKIQKRVSLVSEEQILSMGKEKMKEAFLGSSLEPSDIQKNIITALSPPVIDEMIRLELFEVLKYIIDEQLSQIHLQSIPQKSIDFLFPTLDITKLYSGDYSAKDFGGKITHIYKTSFGEVQSSDESVANSINQAKEICQKNFRLISPTQFALIKDKLDLEILDFLHYPCL